MFKKDDIEVAAEDKEKYISLNVKTDVSWQGWTIKMIIRYVKVFRLG